MQRLGPPHWPSYPPGARLWRALRSRSDSGPCRGAARRAADRGRSCARSASMSIALPIADVPVAGADPVIGDRAYGTRPDKVAAIAGAIAPGLAATAASCRCSSTSPATAAPQPTAITSCRWSAADRATLEATDFAAFRPLAALPLGDDRTCCVHRYRPGRAGHHFGDYSAGRDLRFDRVSGPVDERRYFHGRIVGLARRAHAGGDRGGLRRGACIATARWPRCWRSPPRRRCSRARPARRAAAALAARQASRRRSISPRRRAEFSNLMAGVWQPRAGLRA